MIETEVFNYLKNVLDCPVYMEIPPAPPSSFVVIDKTGSGQNNHIENCTFAIQSYGSSKYNAATLNEAVKTAMLGSGNSYDDGIASTRKVSKCDLNSDYNATDTQNKKYRYQAVFDLILF